MVASSYSYCLFPNVSQALLFSLAVPDFLTLELLFFLLASRGSYSRGYHFFQPHDPIHYFYLPRELRFFSNRTHFFFLTNYK
jgi:hypothetical protein